MRTRDEFFRIMEQQTEIALATSADNVPNVRIVNFYFDPQSKILYFSTFKGNNKVKVQPLKIFDKTSQNF